MAGKKEPQDERDIHGYLQVIHIVVQQKLTQHRKAIIRQLKINLIIKRSDVAGAGGSSRDRGTGCRQRARGSRMLSGLGGSVQQVCAGAGNEA